MAISSGVGSSVKHDSHAAIEDAYTQAISSLNGQEPAFFLLYASSVTYDQQVLLDFLKEKTPQATVLGCSSAGEISSAGGSLEHSLVLLAVASDQMQFVTGTGMGVKEDSEKAGRELVKQIKEKAGGKNPKIIFLLFDGDLSTPELIIKGAFEEAGKETMLFGGGAGDDFTLTQTYQYDGSKLNSGTVVGVGFFGDFSFGAGVRHGLVPISALHKVTKAEANVVHEIDGKPAFETFREYLGDEIEQRQKKGEPIRLITVMYPFGIKAPNEEGYLIRCIMSTDEKGACTINGVIPEGTEIALMLGSADEGVNAAEKAAKEAIERLKGKQPKFALVFSCGTRKMWMLQKRQEEIEILKKNLGEKVPFAGFYSYGEIETYGEKTLSCDYHNSVDIILTIAE